ncbi:MAG: HtaA domain-containing protein [Leucobacter sp.]
MNNVRLRSIRSTPALLTGAAIAGGLLFSPVAAHAAPLAAEDAAGGCEVTGGSLTWGVKESFRSYISGSIANGEWEAADGASYETPNFSWGDATGQIDPATGEGTVSFVGTVHFTGHDGVLDLTLANPTVEFEGDGKAALLLDAKSTDATGEEAIDAKQEWVGDVTAAAMTPADGALAMADMPTVLTNSGAKAFAGFYEAGVELDPVSIDLTLADGCEAGAAGSADAPVAEADPGAADSGSDAGVTETAAPQAAASVPWLPISIGGIALLVIGFTVGLLVGGRKPRGTQAGVAGAAASEGSGSQPSPSDSAADREQKPDAVQQLFKE